MPRKRDPNGLDPKLVEAYRKGVEDGRRLGPVDLATRRDGIDGPSITELALTALTARAFRYIRFTAEDAGKVVHCVAGVATPLYPNHYLYYRAERYEAPHAYVPGLLGKVEAFEEGRLRPSPERRH